MIQLTLLLFIAAKTASAEMEMLPQQQNVGLQIEEIKKFFDVLARQPITINRRNLGATLRARHPKFNSDMWRQGLASPYKRAEAIRAAGALANIGIAATGSSMCKELADQLMSVGHEMITTGDPQFQKIGTSLQQESTSILENNQDAAQSLAAGVNSTNLPDLSNYNPTSSDLQYGSTAQQATAQIAGAVFTTVGTVAGAVIAAYCSDGTGTVQGAMYGAALGGMLGNAIGNAVTGQSNGGSTNIAQIGVQASQIASQSGINKNINQSQSGQQTFNVPTGQPTPIGSAIGPAPAGNGPIAPPAAQSVNTGAAAGSTGL
jgi:hypothetical protein